jgi:glycosyltransferase involved in cell wall biosynthesis
VSSIKYSIVVVTYNRASTLKKCLDSIQNQTYKEFEIIVVDDGSTDNTRQIVQQYENIKYFYKENSGVADSRNFAISKVRSDYFLFVDSDDYIALNLLEKCEEYTGFDVLSFKGIKVNDKLEKIKKVKKVELGEVSGEEALVKYMESKSDYIFPWGYVYNTEFFLNNNFKYNKNYVNEDFGLTPIILYNAKNVISMDYIGYYYVQSTESITRSDSKDAILHGIKSQFHNYDFLVEYFSNNVKNKESLEFYIYIFTRSLLWYGSNLKREYRKIYVKELKKKKLVKNIKFKGYMGHIQKWLCRVDYGFYYFVYIIARTLRDRLKKQN